MKTCWLLVFMFAVTALAWAPYHDPLGYTKSTLDIEYRQALENEKEKQYKELLTQIISNFEERKREDRAWRIIPSEYRTFIRNLNTGIPPSLIYALVYYESWWYPNATGYNPNGTRDLGLMQLNSRYMYHFAAIHYTGREPFNPYNPYHNLEVGLKHFASLLSYYEGDISYALAAYNAGRYRVNSGSIPASTQRYRTRIIQRSISI